MQQILPDNPDEYVIIVITLYTSADSTLATWRRTITDVSSLVRQVLYKLLNEYGHAIATAYNRCR